MNKLNKIVDQMLVLQAKAGYKSLELQVASGRRINIITSLKAWVYSMATFFI